MLGQVEGLPQALRELGKVDRKLRTRVGKQIRTAANPLRTAAQALYPANPLSNWRYGRYAYDQGAARSGVKIKLGGRTGSGGGAQLQVFGMKTIPLVTMIQRNAGGAVYDMAGRQSSGVGPQGRAFVAGLNRHGRASRTMWKAAESKLDVVTKAVEKAVTDVERQVNARLRAGI